MLRLVTQGCQLWHASHGMQGASDYWQPVRHHATAKGFCSRRSRPEGHELHNWFADAFQVGWIAGV